jgi:formylglycine-generating enzyme required for sulfatase activity
VTSHQRVPQDELPDIAWVRIAPGSVQAGSRDVRDPMTNVIEVGLPGSVQICDEFRISRYPVTVVQYQLFIADDGYSSVEYWTSEGLEWIKGNWKSSWGEGSPWLAKHLETASRQRLPLNWVNQLKFKNRPVVGISWFEALAYANWLTSRYWASSKHQLGQDLVVRLPYELEWEAAARGGDTRQWPWGNYWQQDYANTNESGLDRICAVGLHHASDSPHGVSDMSGNTWDWTLSEFSPYGEGLQTVDPSRRDASVTVRGGSWCHDRYSARCAFRDWNVPDDRSDSVGFRLVIGHLAGHVRLGPTSE